MAIPSMYVVRLLRCADGSSTEYMEDKYVCGTVVQDRLGQPHELIKKANDIWGTSARRGEIYCVDPVGMGACYQMDVNGTVNRYKETE